MNKTNKSRRLRKKRYLDEFSIFGFVITCKLKDISNTQFDELLDQLIDELVARDLIIGGGGSDGSFGGFVTSNQRYASPSQEDANYILQWLNNHSAVQEAKVGELIDAQYGDY